MPLNPGPQRLTLVSARQEWQEHRVAMEEKYRKERAVLDSRKNNELLALSGASLRLSEDQRKLEMDRVKLHHKRSIDGLEARRRQEARDFLRTLACPEPQNGQQQPPIEDSLVPGESREGIEAQPMVTQHVGAASAEKESKATGDPRRWELHGTTVRSIPLHSPTSNYSAGDSDTSIPKRKADGDTSPYPDRKRQRTTESAFITPVSDKPDPIKTLMYADVRKNAVDGNDWDTIIEWPEQSKQFWVLFCEEHGHHFKQMADNAAAKHLAGGLHGLPNRDRRPAIVHLGYYIPDCTETLRDSHNTEVNAKYTSGYIPRNDHKRAARVKGPPTPTSGRSQQKSNQSAASQGSSIITHPETSGIYYAKYKGQYWAVVILGWDKLPDGCRHPTLEASELIKHDPPRCYIFDGFKKIIAWKPNYVDGGKSVEKREFPVMYFDEAKNYGWVPAKDLSHFDPHRANAPKRKGYPEGSYNDARDWLAQRWGSKNWEQLSASRKGLRVKDSAGSQPKSPDTIRSGPQATQYRAPQSRDNSESSVSNPNEIISAPDRDRNSTEKDSPPKNIGDSMNIFPIEKTLEKLTANPVVSQDSLKLDIKDREKPEEKPIPIGRIPKGGRSANSTPGLASISKPAPSISMSHSSAPPIAAPSVLAAPVLEAPAAAAPIAPPALAPPVIVPPASTASAQMPTPQTPTLQTQMTTNGGAHAFAADIYEVASLERLITEGDEVRSQIIWQRGSRSEPCVKLMISADGQTAQAQGGPFNLTINPQECRQVRLKTPVGEDGLINEHGIGYVTLHPVSGEASIRMTFDRSDDEDGEMGSKRARYFTRWLWKQNPNMKS